MLKCSADVMPLDQAYRRILTEGVVAAIDVPSFDRADIDCMNAMDTKIIFKDQMEILAEAMGLDLAVPQNPYTDKQL